MSMDDLRRQVANLSRADYERYRDEIERYELEYERMRRREEEERKFQMMAVAPPPMQVSTFVASRFADALKLPVKPPSVDKGKLEALKVAEPYKVCQRAPDRMEVITAWRAWAVVNQSGQYRLKALGQGHIWEPRKQMEAVCTTKSNAHPAPCFDCQCGVWAFKELDGLVSALGKYSDIRVLGNVSLWGRVIETENGYRSQFAYPSELWLLDESLKELGLIYDVPVRSVKSGL